MSKEDFLKEKIVTKRELLRNFFLLLIATLSGSFTVLYKVATREADLSILIMFASGASASTFLAIIMVKLYKEIGTLTEELKDE